MAIGDLLAEHRRHLETLQRLAEHRRHLETRGALFLTDDRPSEYPDQRLHPVANGYDYIDRRIDDVDVHADRRKRQRAHHARADVRREHNHLLLDASVGQRHGHRDLSDHSRER